VSDAALSASAAGANASKTYANAIELDNIVSVSMAKVSDTSAVVCYVDGTEEKAFCNRLGLAGSGDELAVGPEFLLSEGLPGSDPAWAMSGVLSVAALSEERGVACFCDSAAGPTCVPLGLDNATEVSSAGDALSMGAASCSDVSLVAMSETGAIACYLAGEDGVGTCGGLVLNHGSVLTTGDATEIPASEGASDNSFVEPSTCSTNECDMWISVSSRGGANAVACYAGVGGSETGRCRGLSIPPPTSTTTATTATETSSTTEHSTTETSSVTRTETSTLTTTTTATSTTVTTTTETSSTTPHTTTATETTVTTMTQGPEDSGARAGSCAVALVGAVASLLM